jgi:hypothetical protein
MILALDGVDVSQEDAQFIMHRLKLASQNDRFLSVSSPSRHRGLTNDDDDDDDDDNVNDAELLRRFDFQQLAEDDSAELPFMGKVSASLSGLLG